jgi:hypothetical protein
MPAAVAAALPETTSPLLPEAARCGSAAVAGDKAVSANKQTASTTGFRLMSFQIDSVILLNPNDRAFVDGRQFAGELAITECSRHLLQFAEEG